MPSRVLPPSTNPFVHARALLPEESIAREESERLVGLVAGGHNAVLHAPRRFGKTTLINHVLQRAMERDMPGVLIDLSDVLSIADVTARLEQGFRALPGRVRRLVGTELGTVGVSTPFGGVSVGRRSAVADPIAAVHTLLELPAQIAKRQGQRVLVVFDEFQSLVTLEGLDGVFRSHIQHHADVSYIFAGSEPSLLRRFRETDKDTADEATSELVRLAEGHPQRLMLVAHLLWDRVSPNQTATMAEVRGAYDAAMRAVGPELRYLWDSLSANERRVLAAL